MSRWRNQLVCVLALLLAMALQVSAESTANARDAIVPATAPSGPLEETLLKSSSGAVGSNKTASNPNTGTWDMARIPLALGAVVLLILALKWMCKGLAGVSGGKNGGRGVQVLSRSVVSPKEKMLVVRFGRKLLLVGSTGGEMTALCQLDDPDEVAEVLAQLQVEKGTVTKSFGSLFSGAGKAYEREEPVASAEDGDREEEKVEPQPGEELAGLMARIRRMKDQFQQG